MVSLEHMRRFLVFEGLAESKKCINKNVIIKQATELKLSRFRNYDENSSL